MNGAATLDYIASHQAWWILVQVLSLGLSIVAMVVFLALFTALKRLNKSYAAIGAVIALASQVLILSYWPSGNTTPGGLERCTAKRPFHPRIRRVWLPS